LHGCVHPYAILCSRRRKISVIPKRAQCVQFSASRRECVVYGLPPGLYSGRRILVYMCFRSPSAPPDPPHSPDAGPLVQRSHFLLSFNLPKNVVLRCPREAPASCTVQVCFAHTVLHLSTLPAAALQGTTKLGRASFAVHAAAHAFRCVAVLYLTYSLQHLCSIEHSLPILNKG
jgi:hypothetical protein